ncbi:hypothetical protein Q8F55_000136 [Vanrija albida]|uniref:Uncharacterized protein n=1 Tax=Vanrija albida TaxID=181172 RepID=A0ABR3QCE4_9TREE
MLGLTDSPSQLANLGLAARPRDPKPSPLRPQSAESEALPPQLRPRIRQLVATNAANSLMPPPASPRSKPRPSVAAVAQRSQVTNMISAWTAKTPAGASPTPTVPPLPPSPSPSRLAAWREEKEPVVSLPTTAAPALATRRKAVPMTTVDTVTAAKAMFEAPSLPPSPAPPTTPRSRVAERVAAFSQSRPGSPSPMPTRQRPKSMIEPKVLAPSEPSIPLQHAAHQLVENRRLVNAPEPSEPRQAVKVATEVKVANAMPQKKPGWIEWKPSATYDADAVGERLTLDNEDREIVHVGVRPRLHPSRKDQVLANNLPDASIQLGSPRTPLAKTETEGDEENAPGVVLDRRIEASKGDYATWVTARPEREEGMGSSRMWAPTSRTVARATAEMAEAAREALKATETDADRAVRALAEASAASEYHTAQGTPHDPRYAHNPWYYGQGYYYDPAAYQEQYGEYDEWHGAEGYYYDPYWGYQPYAAGPSQGASYPSQTNRAGAGAWAQDQMAEQQALHDPYVSL